MTRSLQTDRRIIGYGTVGIGAFLVLVGVGLVIWQFSIAASIAASMMREIHSTPGIMVSSTGASITTPYVGAILVAIGAVLVILGGRLFEPAPRP
jgi:hypothetical protein